MASDPAEAKLRALCEEHFDDYSCSVAMITTIIAHHADAFVDALLAIKRHKAAEFLREAADPQRVRQAVLSYRITEFDHFGRDHRHMTAAGMIYIGDLVRHTEFDLRTIFGKRILRCIKECIADLSAPQCRLSLGMDVSTWTRPEVIVQQGEPT